MTHAPVPAPTSRMLDALGDPTRRAVFERLAGGPLAVGALAAGLPVSRPAVSQHLRVLKDAGLVIDRAEGTRRLYQANPAGLEALRAYLDRFWDRALASFAALAAAEAEAEAQRPVRSNPRDSSAREKERKGRS
ncbi:MAG: metalloregulator ArsR/SmtB family transcription factor [Anaeromyxobacter sp.]